MFAVRYKMSTINKAWNEAFAPLALVIVLFVCVIQTGFAQNLVPNPSFEIYTDCPSDLNDGEPLQCSQWDHGNEGTVDYYNRCDYPLNMGVPDNIFGFQEPISGDAYVGLKARQDDENYREYALAPLNAPLLADSAYLVSFYISPAETFCYTKPFGALFTVGPPSYNGTEYIEYNPQIEVNGDFLDDYQNWIRISRCFLAQGGENYITIGNFRNDQESAYDDECPLGGIFVYFAYYYLDSVTVEKLPASYDQFTLDDVTGCGFYEIDPGPAENYTWSDGTTNPTLTVIESGAYYVTLSNECAFQYGEIDVTILPDAPPVALPGDTMLCAGESLEITLDTDAGAYEWQDGSNDSEYTITEDGMYIVTLTDDCDVTSDTINVTFLDAPEAFSLGEDTLICDGDAFTISLDLILGDFEWQDGSNSSSYTINDEGIYALTISNSCGQVEDDIEVGLVEPIVFSIGPDQATLCDGDQVLIELDPEFGAFLWHDGSTENNFVISSEGTVSVTITNQCFAESDAMEVTVIEPPEFSLGNDVTVCPGQLPVTFDLSGVQNAEEYLWEDDFTGSIHLINTGGTHSVTISNSCFSVSDAVQITILDSGPEVSLPADQLLCQGQIYTLHADILGIYQWQDLSTADSFLVTAPGIYALTVTNICGSDADSITIDYIPALAPPDLGSDFSLCPGEAGVLYANMVNVTYQWNDLSTADSLIITGPGVYSLQITDACSTTSDTIVISSNANPPDVDLPQTYSLCQGDTFLIESGVTGVQYLWSDGSSLSSLPVDDPGSYSLTVSNACGTDADTISIVDAGPAPVVSLGTDLSLCPGDFISVIPVSTDVQSWLWNDSSTSFSITVSSAGVVYVQGSNQCGLASDTIQVTLLPAIPQFDLGEDLSICPGETVTLAINEPNVDILWHDGTTNAELVVSNPGVIYATIANDCGSASDSVLVSLLDAPPSVDLGADQ
ncbi:MAG TPA: hypothetical protein VI603_11035, partial [Saprospiraceae bacterium]|nr:hypothetical protein [Saprospiraceae bacterium]